MRTFKEQQRLWPSLFSGVTSIGLPTIGFEKLYDLYQANKAGIINKLGFKEGEKPEIVGASVVGAPLELLPGCTERVISLFGEFCGYDLTPEEIITNKLIGITRPASTEPLLNVCVSGAKVSKILARILRDCNPEGDLLDDCDVDDDDEALKYIEDELGDEFTGDDFVRQYFEALAAVKHIEYSISFDFTTMLEGSFDPKLSWTSCFRKGGCYDRGPLYPTCMSNSGIFIAKRNGKIVGRAWVFIDDNYKVVYLARTYGSFNESAARNMLAYLASRLNPSEPWASLPTKGSGITYKQRSFYECLYNTVVPMNDHGWYRDNYTMGLIVVPYLKRMSSKSLFSGKRSRLAPCAVCGRDHEGDSTVCRSCRYPEDVKCSVCGAPAKDDRGLCSSCLAKNPTQCPVCGTWHTGDACPKCSVHLMCSVCGKKAERTSLTSVCIGDSKWRPLCKECARTLQEDTCYICGKDITPHKYSNLRIMVGGHLVCFECGGMLSKTKEMEEFERAAILSGRPLSLRAQRMINLHRIAVGLLPRTVFPKSTPLTSMPQVIPKKDKRFALTVKHLNFKRRT